MLGAHTGLTPEVLSYKPIHPPVEEIQPPKDRAFFADPDKKLLLSAATKKGIVFFRDQGLDLEGQYELFKHYGIQDRDPNQVEPCHVTILGRGGDIRSFEHSSSAFAEFHSDHSFEINPPSYTMLRMIKVPEYGGDTVFASQTALFDKLSPTFKKTLQGLHGVHSSEHTYINTIKSGGTTFRPPVRREHPLIRTHPVTKQQSLFYNSAFVINIAELKGAEALHILNFLRDHLHSADDLSVRWHWEARSVAFWDNRVIVHRAIPGGYKTEREGKRTAVYGEKLFWEPGSGLTAGEGMLWDVDVKTGLDGF
ncbi:hypothetical protein BDV06DRAFT_235096 [Aspergillus oleicola]